MGVINNLIKLTRMKRGEDIPSQELVLKKVTKTAFLVKDGTQFYGTTISFSAADFDHKIIELQTMVYGINCSASIATGNKDGSVVVSVKPSVDTPNTGMVSATVLYYSDPNYKHTITA